MDRNNLIKGTKYTLPVFIAGHIYSFVSNESVDLGEIPTQKQLDDPKVARNFLRDQTYYDQRPIGIPILHEFHRDFELIINLKVLPIEAKRKLVIPLMKRGEKENLSEGLNLKSTDKHLAVLTQEVAERLAGIHLGPYLNKYYRRNIIDPKHIGWDQALKVFLIDWENDPNIKRN